MKGVVRPECHFVLARHYANASASLMSNQKRKNPHAVELGKMGGAAGTGKAKRRGDSSYYSRLAKRRKKK